MVGILPRTARSLSPHGHTWRIDQGQDNADDLVRGRDPEFVRRCVAIVGPLLRRYHRAEVHGMEHVPGGGALIVSNHSGGALPVDVSIFACAFVEAFGAERPLGLLAHDIFFRTPLANAFRRLGCVPTTPSAALQLLADGVATMVFPGGDYDAARPFYRANHVDFGGRTGYVDLALAAGVPIVPTVQIGGQETQLFLSRGAALAKLSRLDKLLRSSVLPVSLGVPFGLSLVLPVNVPLPAKITATVLPPVHPREGESVAEIDARVRAAMQSELDRLARRRRFPVLG